jgi:hypothetical protein
VYGFPVASIVAVVTGLSGLGLSIWTRIDQRRDLRTRQAARAPYGRGVFVRGSERDEWCDLTIVFHSPSGVGFIADRIEVLRPKKARVRWKVFPSPDKFNTGRKIAVKWTVHPDTAKGQASLWCDPAGAEGMEMRVYAKEISALEAPITIPVRVDEVRRVKGKRFDLLNEALAKI